MDNFILGEYVKFAVDNGWENKIKLGCINSKEFIETGEGEFISNTIECITSKDFIEAIARGVEKTANNGLIQVKFPMTIQYTKPYDLDEGEGFILLNDITTYQAIAIRDGKMEEFITNLLNNE